MCRSLLTLLVIRGSLFPNRDVRNKVVRLKPVTLGDLPLTVRFPSLLGVPHKDRFDDEKTKFDKGLSGRHEDQNVPLGSGKG